MRVLLSIFAVTLVVSLIGLAYLVGQKSVDTSLALSPFDSVSCINDDKSVNNNNTLSFPIIKDSNADVASNVVIKQPKDTIDTTVIHAIRKGKWSKQDNKVLMFYLSHLNKKERISVLKQLNKAINYQQMKIGSYVPKL